MATQRTSRRPALDAVGSRRLARSLVVDVAVVLLFVAVGRRNHGEATALSGVADTALPFLLGLFAGWAVVVVRRIEPTSLRAGLVVLVATVGLGMVWRHVVRDEGTPVAFVVVASAVLALFLVGWRFTAGRLRRRAARR